MQAVAAPAFAAYFQRACLVMLMFTAALGALLAGLRLAVRWQRPMALALLLFTVFDLYWFNARQIFSFSEYDSFAVAARLPALPASAARLGGDRVGRHDTVGPDNYALYAGAEEVGGYNPLRLSRVVEFLSAVPSLNAPAFDLLNVRYLFLSKLFHETSEGPATFSQVARRAPTHIYLPTESLDPQKFALVDTSHYNWFELWENQHALPRFFGVGAARVVRDADERLAVFGQPDFDPRQVVILEQPFDQPLGGRLATPVTVRDYDRNRFELEAVVEGGSTLLFMSVPYYPGWQARVDGQPAPVLVANHAFMAVVVPAGTHLVAMDFRPQSFYVGLGLSGVAAALCVLLGMIGLVRRRSPPLEVAEQVHA
jgi:hypothetical protein